MHPDTPYRPFGTAFEQAVIYACRLHARQRRKGSHTPYVAHLLSVAALVIEQGGDEEEAIAALLHDAVEDQGGAQTRKEILHRFGERVVSLVDGCTDSQESPKPPWFERKKAYIDRLRQASPSIRRIALADKLHNLRSIVFDFRQIGHELWGRFKGDKEGTLWYYRSLIAAFKDVEQQTPFIGELTRLLRELEDLIASTPEATPSA